VHTKASRSHPRSTLRRHSGTWASRAPTANPQRGRSCARRGRRSSSRKSSRKNHA
jgi:hypothetical protein